MHPTDIYKRVTETLDAGQRAVVVTTLSGDAAALPEKLVLTEEALQEAGGDASQALALSALDAGELALQKSASGGVCFAEPYFPESRMIVLGGGHIARPLVEFAAKCGFNVTVTDDRPSFANRQRFPLAKRVLCESFDRCIPMLNINRSCFVVIITRGHRHDLDCLREILKLETAYTGMIGSRRRVAGARQQLLSEGYTQETLDLVRAPIGLDIGAETPEEIAVSILSEAVRYKRVVSKSHWPELDTEVLAELAAPRSEPRALVTIIETKGSVPRDVGAKMVVWSDGRTLGSIGGGCSEGGVITAAYDVIRNGGHRLVDVDMTGDVAEDEGMVCGGTMKVVIEKYAS
ncbi:xanthine dehydrogenase accessory factor [Sporobacter termitidis DSM 10068]|uniref:Xanthine dehydrogenase accessory factor n=1 Tax=Sporobacter termitidis DSM 10068 TaxID=1123282 RepID=A0A1M5Z101_9FIRM|nr:XdhC/CoxI family protein [Sporobacter termitidis]SHI17850.1 xanthine dehydrogenase accessory factor [Sporobacter termitidis DSM 10068]